MALSEEQAAELLQRLQEREGELCEARALLAELEAELAVQSGELQAKYREVYEHMLQLADLKKDVADAQDRLEHCTDFLGRLHETMLPPELRGQLRLLVADDGRRPQPGAPAVPVAPATARVFKHLQKVGAHVPGAGRVLQFGAALGGQPAAAAVADGVEAAGGEAEDAGQLAGDAEQQQEQWGEPGEQDQWDGPGEPQRPGQQPGAWDEPEEPADWEHFAPPQAGGGDAAAAEADAAAYEEAPGGMWDGADGGHADFGLGLEEDGEEAEGYEAEGYGAAEEAGAWFPGFQTPVGEEEAGTPDMPVRRMLQLEGAAEPAGGEWQGGAAQRAAGKELGEHIPMAGAPQSPQSPAAGQLERNGGYEEVEADEGPALEAAQEEQAHEAQELAAGMPGASWAAQVALLQKAVEGLLTPRPQALISFDFRGRNSVVAVGEGDQEVLVYHVQQRGSMKELTYLVKALAHWELPVKRQCGTEEQKKALLRHLTAVTTFRAMGIMLVGVAAKCSDRAASGGTSDDSLRVDECQAPSPMPGGLAGGQPLQMLGRYLRGNWSVLLDNNGMTPYPNVEAASAAMLTLRMAMSDLHDRLEAAWALHTGTAPVSLCGAIVARLTPLLDLAAETHSCDALLRSPGCVDDMLTAMELVVKCYQDMDCATFADEQHLAEQAQALLLQFSAELEQYGSSLE